MTSERRWQSHPGCSSTQYGYRLPDANMPLLVLYDIADHFDQADNTERNVPADPIEPTDKKEPIEPIDSAEPTDPMERMEPLDPMERMEPSDHNDHRESTLLRDVIASSWQERC